MNPVIGRDDVIKGEAMVKKKRLLTAIHSAVLLGLSATAVPAWAAPPDDWQPELAAAAKGVRGPSDPFQILLPRLPGEVLGRLVVELDDMDATSFMTREERQIVLTPPYPLGWGQHQLRLVEHTPDGGVVERGLWNFEIRKTAAFREAEGRVAATLTGARRISDKDLPAPVPRRDTANGSAQLYGAVAEGDFRATGQMDLFYNSQETLMPRGIPHGNVDLGQFLLTAEAGPVVARAGHHSVGPESLIMQGFTRRGVSVGLQSAETGAAATAFSLRTQDVIGFTQGFGIGDDDNRTSGVVLSGRPIAPHRDALVVSATALSSEGPSQFGALGTGLAGDSTATAGDAAGIVADGNALDKRLRLRGEYASTRYDFDGKGRDTDWDGILDSNQDPERDKAYAGLVTFTPWHDKVIGNQPFVWNLGVENKRLGTFFKSPANHFGLSDRRLLRGFTDVNWSGLGIQASFGRETDNVNDLELLPRTATTQGVLSLSFTPQLNIQPGPDGNIPPLPWYGQPMFNATYIGVDQDVEKAAAGLSVGALNTLTTLSLSGAFSYQTWSWSLNHTLGKNTNFINMTADTQSRSTQLTANFRLGARLTVGPMVQYNKIEESDPPAGFTAKDSETTTAGLNLAYLFSERVTGNLGVNSNRQKTTDNTIDSRSLDYTGNLSWVVFPARGAQPGFTLSLEGQYRDVDDRVFLTNNQNTYQVFLKGAISWLPTF